MAIPKRRNLSKLTKEEIDILNKLNELSTGSLDYLLKTGKLPDISDTQNYPPELKKRVEEEIIPKVLETRLSSSEYTKQLQDFISEQGEDVSKLDEEGLQDRIDAILEQQNIETEPDIVRSKRFDELRDKILPHAFSVDRPQGIREEATKSKVAEIVAKIVNGQIKTDKELSALTKNLFFYGGQDVLDNIRDEMRKAGKPFEYYRAETELPVAGRLEDIPEVLTLQDLLRGKQDYAANLSSVQDFLQRTPGELDELRNKFIMGQRERAKDFVLSEYSPQVLEELGARGLADSGEVGSEIARKTFELESKIGAERQKQELDDFTFFSDLAYSVAQQDLTKSQLEFSNQLAFQKTSATNRQRYAFLNKQSDIENAFSLENFRRENERALANYDRQLEQESSRKKKQDEAALISDIVGTGVQVGTAVALGGAKPIG